jgi:death-on-curing protein
MTLENEPTERTEPTWVPRLAVIAAHFDQLQEHGGEHGVREQGALLDAALARPRNKFAYETESDLADLAAAYAFAIGKTSCPFLDGNKRTAFVTAVIFLILNGYTITHSEDAAGATMLAVADGSLSEAGLAAWFRSGIVAK